MIVIFNHATRININYLKRIFHVKKNVLYVKKLIVDLSIIHFKKSDSIKKFENKYFQLRIKSNFNKNMQH